MAGLTNEQYALWLNETASQDCGDVQQIEIKYSDETEDTITSGICNWMEDTDASELANIDEVKFSGVDGDDRPWHAIDARVTTNLERTVNFADVPANIKRPTGA